MDGDITRVSGLLRGDRKNQINEYTDLFDTTGADARKTQYTDVVNKYYDLATDFYEFGWGSSFHFAPRHKWESLQSSIERHEMWLSNRLGLTEGQTCIGILFEPIHYVQRLSYYYLTMHLFYLSILSHYRKK